MVMAKKTKQAQEVVQAFKGFDQNFQCRGFQFEVGKSYEHAGSVKACSSGFHACVNPLDVFGYYPPGTSRFATVEQRGDLARHAEDSKIASRSISIKAELTIHALVKAAVDFTFNRAAMPTSGNYAHSATSGNYANSATSGYSTKAEAKGENAVAACAGSGIARAGAGGAIFIVERDRDRRILSVFSSKVGENGIEPNVFYSLRGGKPIAVKESE